jgi:hypothetical protein
MCAEVEMNPASVLYLVGSAIFFLAERSFSTNEMLRYPMWLLSALLIAMALGRVALSLSSHTGTAKKALGFFGLSISSVFLYLLVLFEAFGDDKGGRQLTSAARALIPLVWTIGALPALNLARTIHINPKGAHPLREAAALEGGLAVALGVGMLFPINYLASEFNKEWNYGYFKTTAPGDASLRVVENISEPLRVLLFFPTGNDVLREVERYFEPLQGENLSIEVIDQAMDPEMAKQYKVRENGTIALVRGERTETIKLGLEFDKVKKDLRKLDSKVHTAMLKLASDKKTAYFTVGHDEMFWKNAPGEDEKIDLAKKYLENLNFKAKEIGLEDGLGQEIPTDAAIVFIVGPKRPFLPAEVKALENYRNQGGSIFAMLEPGMETPDPALYAMLGVSFNNAVNVTDKERGYVAVTNSLVDRTYVATNKFTSHESISNLQKNADRLALLAPGSGAIGEAEGHPGKYTAVIKGMPDWWPDLNSNYEYDKDTEKKGSQDLAAVMSGPASGGEKSEWRQVVIGDATWLSNLVAVQVAGNQGFFIETVGWLAQDPVIGGEQESEEDIKIQHTKEGQQYWFLGATVGVPGLVMLVGVLNVRRRKKA